MIRFLLVISFILLAAQSFAENVDPRKLVFKELKYEIPKTEKVMLDSGTAVYLLKDSELPIVSITAMIHTGSVYDPAGKSGLASLTGIVMRSGGAGSKKAEEINEELEFMSSAVESHILEDSGKVSLTTLTKNLKPTLQIFSDVIFKPRFDEKRFLIAKNQMLEAIRRQNDDPKEIAAREIEALLYKNHPLGDYPKKDGVTSITANDLREFHSRFFRTDNMILAVSGDFDKDELLKELNRLFKKNYSNSKQIADIPQPESIFKREVVYVKKDVNQSVIKLGHLGITKDNPDLYPLRLLNYILGGSFTSRLTTEIRTNQGLAYNVSSSFDIGAKFIGTFIAETETKSESTSKAINSMLDIMNAIRKDGVTDQELKNAKDYIINSFMFGFTTPASIVTQKMRLEFYGYPADYLDRYREKIAKVTKEDVLAAARKYLQPDKLKILVVGDGSKFDSPLSKFGTVAELTLESNSKKVMNGGDKHASH